MTQETIDFNDFAALGALAAREGKDMTKASAGGGDFAPPAAGFCLLRLVGYFELGKQAGSYAGKPTVKDKVRLIFELSGPRHAPTVTESGESIPHRIVVDENLSLNEKARFFKLFGRLNYAGDATHMVQLLGRAYKGFVIHRKYTRSNGTEAVVAELYDKAAGSYTIEPPRREVIDMDESSPTFQMPTGEYAVMAVPPALTPLKAFMWDYSPLAHWDALFVDGEYPERKDEKTGKVTAPAKSKNALQNLIKSAVNFKGSRLYELIAAKGGNLDIPEVGELDESTDEDEGTATPPPKTKPVAPVPQGADADDALNGIG